MIIQIDLSGDSHNTVPTAKICFEDFLTLPTLRIWVDDGDREIYVERDEFVRAAEAIGEMVVQIKLTGDSYNSYQSAKICFEGVSSLEVEDAVKIWIDDSDREMYVKRSVLLRAANAFRREDDE